MAVRSTVGDSLAALGDGLLNYRSQMQRTRANKLALDESQRQVDRMAEQELMAVVEQAGDYRIDPTGTSGALFQYDFGRLAEERPDVAKRILNADPRFNMATDERGRKIQTEVDSFVKNDDGTYSVVIRRPDGRRAPITENRSAAGNDVVAKFSGEDFNRIGSNYLGAIVAKGAGDNRSTFLRDASLLTDSMLRSNLLDAAAESPLSDDPAGMSQFWALVNRADGKDLESIATDFGVDVAGIRAQAEAEAQPAPEEAPRSVRGPNNVRERRPMTDEERANSDDRMARVSANREAQRQRLQDRLEQAEAKKATRGRSRSRQTTEIDREIAEARKALEQFDARVARMGGGPATATGPTLEEAKARADAFTKENPSLVGLSPEKLAEAREIYGDLDRLSTEAGSVSPLTEEQKTFISEAEATAAPDDTSTLPESGVTPPVALNTRDQVLKALREQLAQPSDEQIQQMSQYLQSKGVQKASDLSRLPTREAHMAAWLMASRQGGTAEDRTDLANKLLNYVDTGSQEVNRPNLDYQNTRLRQLDQQAANQASSTQLQWRRFFTEQEGLYNAEVSELFEKRGADVIAGVVDEDGEYQTPTSASTQALDSMIAEANRLSKGSPQERAAAQTIPHFLLAHVRGFVAGRSPGFFDIGDQIDNWFNDDGQLVVGDDSSYLRVIKDSKGTVTDFQFVHPSGNPEYDFAVSRQALERQYSPEAMEYLIALAEENAK